jgi:hypothetical protein
MIWETLTNRFAVYILRDITTYFEDSVFPIREINSML